jgi:hypothetical protein
MYNIINYFFKKSSPETPEAPLQPCQPPLTVKNRTLQGTRNKRVNTVYVVLHKNTRDPLGIFDDFERAKANGEKSTHHNCIIIPFQLNDPCKYLFNPVFENK